LRIRRVRRRIQLEALRAAIAEARTTAEKIAALAEAVATDRTVTPEAGQVKLRQRTLALSEKIAAKLDEARARAAREVEAITKATATPPPPKDQLAAGLEAELRQRLYVMSDKQRSQLIGTALKDGDQAVMGALLRGHHALVGMSQAEHDVRREQWRNRMFPVEADRIARLQKAIEATDRAGRSFVRMVESIVKNPVAEQAEASAATVKAMEAAE
jgi:hypothetical protein